MYIPFPNTHTTLKTAASSTEAVRDLGIPLQVIPGGDGSPGPTDAMFRNLKAAIASTDTKPYDSALNYSIAAHTGSLKAAVSVSDHNEHSATSHFSLIGKPNQSEESHSPLSERLQVEKT